ncbi:MAG: ParA family protein [Cytophagales bacterium]|jgi:chromosome partitioning protein|nr:ParA family protein [Cytophagales bacterium]MCA6390749.1 ParA family protein [Cytophagales bacterium]MCA6396968.1 ParA family protein [Cytophagales bacterium]MCA6403923.1 ParA family protein [Cytophagales bacterium]MCA6405827.1 ParA family protein [Cytophagales bacterium]
MTHIISILNHKGGTGKTTTTLNLGKALNLLGQRVLLIDLDAQANLSQSLGVEDEALTVSDSFSSRIEQLPIKELSESFHLVPASLDLSAIEPGLYANINSYFRLKTLLHPIKEAYDIILIDCPPSLGIFTQNALIASSSVLITVQAQYLALKGLNTVKELVATIKDKLNPLINIQGLVVTQTNHTKLSKDILSTLRNSFQQKVYTTTIRQNVAIAEASAHRKDVFSYNPESFGAIDYMNLAKEIML